MELYENGGDSAFCGREMSGPHVPTEIRVVVRYATSLPSLLPSPSSTFPPCSSSRPLAPVPFSFLSFSSLIASLLTTTTRKHDRAGSLSRTIDRHCATRTTAMHFRANFLFRRPTPLRTLSSFVRRVASSWRTALINVPRNGTRATHEFARERSPEQKAAKRSSHPPRSPRRFLSSPFSLLPIAF